MRRTSSPYDRCFQANREAPIFAELQGLFAKTAGLTDVLRESLAQLGEGVLVAFVFGSAARGELRASSDIGLLVVWDAAFQDVVGALAGAEAMQALAIGLRDDVIAWMKQHHAALLRK